MDNKITPIKRYNQKTKETDYISWETLELNFKCNQYSHDDLHYVAIGLLTGKVYYLRMDEYGDVVIAYSLSCK